MVTLPTQWYILAKANIRTYHYVDGGVFKFPGMFLLFFQTKHLLLGVGGAISGWLAAALDSLCQSQSVSCVFPSHSESVAISIVSPPHGLWPWQALFWNTSLLEAKIISLCNFRK